MIYEVIELHVLDREPDSDIWQKLQTFCDQNRIEIIRLFWRGLEAEDREILEGTGG